MDEESAYQVSLTLYNENKEDLIKRVIPPELLDGVYQRLKTELAVSGPAETLSSVETPFWYRNDNYPKAEHWPRYYDLLKRKPGFGGKIAKDIDLVSTQIMNQMPNPKKEKFGCHGLVIGHVQSGKTANYTGVIAKAVDAGYNLIIVFAGLHNILRTQTQIRLDRELTGENRTKTYCEKPSRKHRWMVLTKDEVDFYGTTPTNILQNETPILIVLKKNCTVLRRLVEWLKDADKEDLEYKKVLFIDDEADHGSIDTGKEDEGEEGDEEYDDEPNDLDPSETNRQVRIIRNVFESYAYIGYTATPFANVLTSPFDIDEYGETLYPRDFIISLPKPENYIGTAELFPNNPEKSDSVDQINIVSEKDAHIMNNGGRPMGYDDNQGLPSSLINSVADFVLTGVVKEIRNVKNQNHSMLIHTSHLVDIQNAIYARTEKVWNSWKSELTMPSKNETYNVVHRILEKRWKSEFYKCNESWDEIRKGIAKFAQKVNVREINSSSDDTLDYDRYPSGMKVIAIGGNRLSRGLTLEGLTVSYYTRESEMYDTLLQMCRWFGFRAEYEDLMRLHMTSTLRERFSWLAEVEEALRRDVARYEQEEKNPEELATRILTHAILKPTRKYKLKNIKQTRVGWDSVSAETLYFHFDRPDILQSNLDLLLEFVCELENEKRSQSEKKNVLWRDVSPEKIVDFLSRYQSTGQDMFDSKAMCKYIKTQSAKYGELKKWAVHIKDSTKCIHKENLSLTETPMEIGLPQRSRNRGTRKIGRLVSPVHYSVDLPGYPKACKNDEGQFDVRKMFEKRGKDNGLLIIYLLDKDGETWKSQEHKGAANPLMPMFEEGDEKIHVVGLVITFPSSDTAEKDNYIHVRGISPEVEDGLQ